MADNESKDTGDASESDLSAFDGVVDTAFGTPIIIREDGAVAVAEYDENWNVIPVGEPVRLVLPDLPQADEGKK
ncbi:hypothetical protein ABT024_03295 [Streptomyces sp. NPDC002812]|uniref:hypothetical protein n=1 Tax=Streptomyces sp. NPDC002812 TaxID=3154434 RepID=UPI0033220553